MAKLNKTRTLAAALLGTLFLSAPITSYAKDFRSTSHSVNTRIISSTFTNRGISQSRFNTRNNIGLHKRSLGHSNLIIATPLIKIKSNIFTPKFKTVKLAPKKVIVKKTPVLLKTRRGY